MPTLCCPNPTCQTANELEREVCSACQTPLVKKYLWAVGDWIKAYQIGELIEERYRLVQPQVLLDTLPAQPTSGPDEMPPYIAPYLKLFGLRLHLPQVYDYFPSSDPEMDLSVWLLDPGAVPLGENGEPQHPELLPPLGTVWSGAGPLLQLTWLWQMAKLWQPLQAKNVVSSLLEPDFLKVNGYQVQLRELRLDEHQFYELRHLAPFWGPLLEQSDPLIAPFCETLGRRLSQGKIPHSERLIQVLETAITDLSNQYDFKYQILTLTDQGPNREHNEDACYPPSGLASEGNQLMTTLTLIGDGVGGQEGGEVAAQWVAEYLPLMISNQVQGGAAEPSAVLEILKNCIEKVNDQLNSRNDAEERRERERMGTTLVLALAQNQQFYWANVGDSRCYWLTPDSCLQMTVDDDLACREVRLGYMLYREALELPRSGALTQAMGLAPSSQLYPVIQYAFAPADSLFLLCSDGLSDFNRVEQYWRRECLGLFNGEKTLEELAASLVNLANTQNGHDNVTVGLLFYQPRPPQEGTPVLYPRSPLEKETQPPAAEAPEVVAEPAPQPQPQLLTPTPPVIPPTAPKTAKNIILPPWVFGVILGLLALGGGWWGWQSLNSGNNSQTPPPGQGF